MRRLTLALATVVVVATGIVAWRLWSRDPGQVAPELTPARVARLDGPIRGSVTWVGGGSREEARRLWLRYHEQTRYQGVTPRLLGISLVHVSFAPGDPGQSGYFWLVYCDRAWEPNMSGLGGVSGYYVREVVMVPQGSGTTSRDIYLGVRVRPRDEGGP